MLNEKGRVHLEENSYKQKLQMREREGKEEGEKKGEQENERGKKLGKNGLK